MEWRYDTFCGLYCGACDVLQANRRGAVESLAHAWGMEPDQLRCHGCKSHINAVYCVDCGIKACGQARGVGFCFQCDDYPCARLVGFRNDGHAHHAIVLENLGHIRQHGVGRWLETQRVRWSCPECGVEFTWYDETCRACGSALFNCVEEARLANEGSGSGPP